MENLIVRCSELHRLMTKSRTKSNPLGDTCKTYVMEKAKENHYGIRPNFSNKYTEKGLMNENKGIDLVNMVRFMDFKKNSKRLTNDYITGECDINGDDRIIDIKCSWSFDTFPCFKEEAFKQVKKSGYDWQMVGYMWLYNKQKAEVIYCLTSTPVELLGYNDEPLLHNVDHIDPADRLTSVTVERNLELEEQIIEKYEMANTYFKECLAELNNKHKKQEAWI